VRAIVISTDPILISYAGSLLEGAGISAVTFDQNASIVEGSIGALPRRLVVPPEQYDAARRVLTNAGLGDELAQEPR